jgi:DNA-binding CsgD family transcriptional regulator
MYRCALGSAGEVVDAATDLLAAGEDSMLLAQLAGISKGQADMEVGQALPGAMESVSAPLFDAESTECQLVAVDGLAERYRNGVIDGRELVRRVHVRFGHVSPALIEALRENLHNQGVTIPRGPSTATRSHRAGLTTRQAEVLSLLAEGLSNAAIADRLFLSTRTVEHHVAAVIGKLDVTNRDDAVETARREGYLPAGEEPS